MARATRHPSLHRPPGRPPATHLATGYGYKLARGTAWRGAPDDAWEIVVLDAGPAKVLGRRDIDGAACVVVARGGKIYAQNALHVTRQKPEKP